jgi:hypothetical protein
MNKNKLLKLTGLFVVSSLVLALAAYFLYPYLNEQKYRQTVEDFQTQDSTAFISAGLDGSQPRTHSLRLDSLQKEEKRLRHLVDSLQAANTSLKEQLEELAKADSARKAVADEVTAGALQDNISEDLLAADNNGSIPTPAEREPFSERVKSLLNLDEEELALIINHLSNSQLVRLYRGGGTIQREKLLRSLKPERAAELIEEIML